MQVPVAILVKTEHPAFSVYRGVTRPNMDSLSTLNPRDLNNEALQDLLRATKECDNTRLVKSIQSILDARAGLSTKVFNFDAFLGVLQKTLEDVFVKGWIWSMEKDGDLYPYAIQNVEYFKELRSDDKPTVVLTGACWALTNDSQRPRMSVISRKWSFSAGDVSRRSIKDILASSNLFLETSDLSSTWETVQNKLHDCLQNDFAKVFRTKGPTFDDGWNKPSRSDIVGARVIMDVDPSMITPPPSHIESFAYSPKGQSEEIDIPHHPILRVFDLKLHEFYKISLRNLTPHVFDMSLRDKIVLPQSHRDLLDILTEDATLFTSDIVEGKRSGNLILCKGIPGVGKTLTAEVYAELTSKALYSVHAGILGTSAADIAKKLQTVFASAKRWNCVLLIDEADVFVMSRGTSIQNNAVVAEFLRTLEYFDGLLFMTTNRPDDIDDAILSRCAAIISYQTPTADHAKKIWRAMLDNFSYPYSDELIDQASKAFPKATGRDIKMLLSLSLRVASKKNMPLNLDILRQCSIFRGMIAEEMPQ